MPLVSVSALPPPLRNRIQIALDVSALSQSGRMDRSPMSPVIVTHGVEIELSTVPGPSEFEIRKIRLNLIAG